MSDWKNVQYKDGKMRTNEGGGGGSSTFADLDDISFNNLQNGQIPKYNSTTKKWENANESGGGGTVTDVEVDGISVVNQSGVAEIPAIPDGLHHYSTTEHVIGTWIDGKPLYEKTCVFTLTQNNGKTVKNYSHNIANIETIVAVICKENRPRPYYGGEYEISVAMNNSNFEVETGRDRTTYEVIVIAQPSNYNHWD